MLIAGALSFLVVALVEFLIMRLQLFVPENTSSPRSSSTG